MMSLVAHPEAKCGLALRLRTLCRRALPLGSSLHRKLCWQLLKHRQEIVRNHIMRLVRYDGQIIWRAGGRADSEITNESTAGGRDGQHWAECRCDPVREIVEEEMLPCLSNVLSQEKLRRWLLPLRNTVWICRCGGFYKHIEGGPVLSPLALYVFEQEMLPCLSNRLTMSLMKVIRGDGEPSGSA